MFNIQHDKHIITSNNQPIKVYISFTLIPDKT